MLTFKIVLKCSTDPRPWVVTYLHKLSMEDAKQKDLITGPNSHDKSMPELEL